MMSNPESPIDSLIALLNDIHLENQRIITHLSMNNTTLKKVISGLGKSKEVQ